MPTDRRFTEAEMARFSISAIATKKAGAVQAPLLAEVHLRELPDDKHTPPFL